MEDATGDLDRLPRMSPVDEPAVPAGAGGLRRRPWITIQEAMIVSGVGLILVCGLLLFFVYGLATMVPDDEPGYRSLVLERMFGLEYGGWTTIPSSLGLLVGIGLVSCGIFRGDRLLWDPELDG